MENKPWNKMFLATIIGFILLLGGIVAFYFTSGYSGSPVYLFTIIGIAAVIIIIGIVWAVLVAKGKIIPTELDYRAFFIIGAAFTAIGISSTNIFFIMGLVFMAIGLANKNKWKNQPKWSELPPAQRKFKTVAIIILGILVLGGLLMWYKGASKDLPKIPEEMLRVAGDNSVCSDVGVLSDRVFYNPNSKTWWIDLERMPELQNDGCNPACVVSEETLTAEVNWRCTGLKQ